MSDMFRLDGKVAVVIGGAGGIGEALALGVSRYGAAVVAASRNLEALGKVVDKIKAETGGEVSALAVDVTSEESLEGLVKGVVDKHGRVDVLINAMGMNIKRPALEYPPDDWDRLFAANVRGTMMACKHFGRVMKDQGGGCMLNLSSVRGIRGLGGGNVGYCATKGAVELLTKSLAIELAPFKIRVNALGPALVVTPGTAAVVSDPARVAGHIAKTPLGRLGMPEDLIGATVFLCSEASAFMTGQTLYVDGGMTAS